MNVLTIGGITGKANTFTPLVFNNLTGGVFGAATLLQGDSFACFMYQAASLTAPDILKGLYADITKPLAMLSNVTQNGLSWLSFFGTDGIDAN
jgi:hypothetical protein